MSWVSWVGMVSGFFTQEKLKRLQNELDEMGWYGEWNFHAREIENIAK